MLDKFWELLKGGENLIEEAHGDCLRMLATTKEMFRIVVQALEQETDFQVREKVAAMDKKINREQQEVRKKVFEHLALSRGRDLLQGLQLTVIVIDLERIGDYGKNIGELVDILPASLNFNEHEETYRQIKEKTLELFDLTRDTFRDADETKADQAMWLYDSISKLCDGTLMQVLAEDTDGDQVEKWKLGLVLLLRYMKRVSAHLKNISSAVNNPFHRIGYRTRL